MDIRERGIPYGIELCDRSMTITFPNYMSEYEDVTITIKAKHEVCDVCDGRGQHVNPSIDSHGIGAEEWERDWDEESRRDYMEGGFDVTCTGCKGKRVRLVPAEQSDAWDYLWQSHAEDMAEAEAERRAGC